MKKHLIWLVALSFPLAFGSSAVAVEDLVQIVSTGCKKELKTYCKDVTHGEGRVLACLYSHNDKLTGECEYALYDAAVQLERAIAAMAYVANECGEDIDKRCSSVELGEGRLMACFEKNKKKLSSRCKKALKETGMD